jgi:hypothetical protein
VQKGDKFMRGILVLSIFFFTGLLAQARPGSDFTYDLMASSGSQNNYSYSEIKLSLNWYATDWLNWRNGVFTRFGTNVQSVTGLDSSLLFTWDAETDGGGLGIRAFAGPGVRMASANNNAATAEAGLVFKVGGLELGGGAKYLSYFNARQDPFGFDLPRNETQYFIILAGGGSF